MILPLTGYYLLMTPTKRYGAYSNDIFSDWNSHLMLKSDGLHPLGKDFTLVFLGNQRVAFEEMRPKHLPKADKNYGVKYCEKCGKIFVGRPNQRFHSSSCRINSFMTKEKIKKKSEVLKKHNYKCAMLEACPHWGTPEKLVVWWQGDGKPYCRTCFYKVIMDDKKKE